MKYYGKCLLKPSTTLHCTYVSSDLRSIHISYHDSIYQGLLLASEAHEMRRYRMEWHGIKVCAPHSGTWQDMRVLSTLVFFRNHEILTILAKNWSFQQNSGQHNPLVTYEWILCWSILVFPSYFSHLSIINYLFIVAFLCSVFFHRIK